jgi:hypothetical protein
MRFLRGLFVRIKLPHDFELDRPLLQPPFHESDRASDAILSCLVMTPVTYTGSSQRGTTRVACVQGAPHSARKLLPCTIRY